MRTFRLVAVLLVSAHPFSVFADPPRALDLDEWLDARGTSALAVQLLPRRCSACTAAQGSWRGLAERFRASGLRTVVVLPGRAHEACAPVDLGWTPDAFVCDAFGSVQQAFAMNAEWEVFAATKGPVAFLWSWDGDLLVSAGDVGDLAPAIEASSRSRPTLDLAVGSIAPASGLAHDVLFNLARAEFEASNKFRVQSAKWNSVSLPSHAHETRSAERDRCDGTLGSRASALAEIGSDRRLSLVVLDENRCHVASASVPWSPIEPPTSIARGVRELTRSLRHLEMPTRAGPAPLAKTNTTSLTAPGDFDAKEERRRGLEKIDGLEGKSPRALLDFARRWLGTRYAEGGESKATGIDIAPFVRALYLEVYGLDLGPDVDTQWKAGSRVPMSTEEPSEGLEPGDLIFLMTLADVPKEVGVHLGGGHVIQSGPIRGVTIDGIPVRYSAWLWFAARRPLATAPSEKSK